MTIARLKSPITGYQLITLIFTRNARPIRYLDRASRDSQRPFCGSLSLSLSLSLTFSLSFSLCTCNRCIRTHVVPFLELVVFHPFPIPSTFAKSYPHLRSRHGLSTRFRFEHDTRPPAPSSLNAFQTDVPARDSARCFGIPRWVRVTPAKFNYIGRSVATWIREIRAYKEEEIKNRKFSRGLLND